MQDNNLNSYFEYFTGDDVLPKDVFKISPSRLNGFFGQTYKWYRENLLGEEAAFLGNTGSHLGTTVHGLAAMFFDDVDQAKAYEAAECFIFSITDENVDKTRILECYRPMFEMLRDAYLIQAKEAGVISEKFDFHPVTPRTVLGGSMDIIILKDKKVVDIKTTSARTEVKGLSEDYRKQLLSYVWLLRKKGYDIRSYEIVWVHAPENRGFSEKGNKLKDYPTQVYVHNYEVSDTDMEITDGVLHLVGESVEKWYDNPELRYLLAQDYRLKTINTTVEF